MAREKAKVPIQKLHELTVGPPHDFFALLVEKHRASTRENKPFYHCKFRDSRRTVSCVVWGDAQLFPDCEHAWHVGNVYKIRGTYQEHEKYGPQIEVLMIREVTVNDRDDGLNEADFFERSRFDSDAMFAELRKLVEAEIRDQPLRTLTLGILDANLEAIKRLPAHPRNFYPFPGGWLEHVLSVTKNCCWLADRYLERYPELKSFNRDLVIAGAVLHDIGRVAELTVPEKGQQPTLTVEGHLFGHIQLSRDLVREAGRIVPELNSKLLQLLEHMILSHLTRPEWGSPRLPMIPEVLILHHADDLDAKFEMYARHIIRDLADGPVTERDPILGRPLLKLQEAEIRSAPQN
jgi:3'-5' exoribonuclease